MFGRGDDDPLAPDPTPGPGTVEDTDIDYTVFGGRLFLNQEELELDSDIIVAKGLVHLSVLDLAQVLDIEVEHHGDSRVLFISEVGDVRDEDAQAEELNVYRGDIEITPSNVIYRGGEIYIAANELAPMLDLYLYENQFANTVYLVDDGLPAVDGQYVAVLGRDARGWAPELRITISGGSIVAVEYFELNLDGNNKYDDEEYLANWGQAIDQDPLALITQLENQLAETNSGNQVDFVSGATGTWIRFRELTSLLLAKARVGALDFVYPEGLYTILGHPDERGWTPVVEMVVTGGRIIQIEYDEFDENGNSKRGNEQYIHNWRNAFPEVDPIAMVQEREENILTTQDPNIVDATTGATAWGVNLKKLVTGALDHAAQAQLDGDRFLMVAGETSQRGDRPQLLLGVSGEQVVSADFSDYRNGIAKKLDEPYLDRWREEYPEVQPLELLTQMEESFVQAQDPQEIDEVTGATAWREVFQDLARRAMEFLQTNND